MPRPAQPHMTFDDVWDHRTFNQRQLIFFAMDFTGSSISFSLGVTNWQCESVYIVDMKKSNGTIPQGPESVYEIVQDA